MCTFRVYIRNLFTVRIFFVDLFAHPRSSIQTADTKQKNRALRASSVRMSIISIVFFFFVCVFAADGPRNIFIKNELVPCAQCLYTA